MSKYKIPFDAQGNQMAWGGWRVAEWKDNYRFVASLKFDGFHRGRSSAGATFVDGTGKSYNMFLKDLSKLLTSGMPDVPGVYTAEWTFCKRGENYGVMLAI